MTFFLITTDHLETRLWFRDDEDFRTAMNYIAILAFTLDVQVLAFILMSNHVHFVLAGGEKEAIRFISQFKNLYSRYLNRKYGTLELLRRNGVDIRKLALGDESLERAIAYVQMNCVAANICLQPADYPWGTGNTFFRVTSGKGSTLGQLSARTRIRILHSKAELPPEWILGETGFILPESYANVKFVESLFRTPRRMNYFLQNSSKAKLRLSRNEGNLPSFRDQVLLAALPDLCVSLFREKEIKNLKQEQQGVLLDQIRRRFGADLHQISRVTGIPYPKVAALLEGF